MREDLNGDERKHVTKTRRKSRSGIYYYLLLLEECYERRGENRDSLTRRRSYGEQCKQCNKV